VSEITRTTSPYGNFVVHAAAGTGKTWLLTSRIIHLLLTGANPGSVLAITFTRKAAAEIQERVSSRLLEMAGCTDAELIRRLQEIGCEVTPSIQQNARRLYEQLLASEQPLRINTFHGFCQELLQRFPLESGLPPGFQLVESTTDIEASTWRAFENRVRLNPVSDLAKSFDILLHLSGTPAAAHEALSEFLEHRSDWWAFTETSPDPVGFAQDYVSAVMAAGAGDIPTTSSLRAISDDALRRYAQLLGMHPTKTHLRYIDLIELALAGNASERAFLEIHNTIYRDSNGRRKHIKPNKTLEKKLGADGTVELLRLHAQIADQLDTWRDRQRARQNLERNRAWIVCGHALLELFQAMKQQQGVLDFADLEWQAYRLLSNSEHAQWVQYKLDQRIDHLLVDEFQDTNPTQWHLILPLLDEMAAGQTERHRSAFVVGDIKQSIYRFRRAAPDLFHHAKDWLTLNMGAESASQQKSYRSSPAIIEFVNLIFRSTDDQNSDHYHLHDFTSHDTYHSQRWGRVELLPVVKRVKANTAEPITTLRDPLSQARANGEDVSGCQYRKEAQLIVKQIQDLIGKPIKEGEQTRPIEFRDIMILVRSRTHTDAYEAALRQADIPFTGVGKGQFQEAIEIRDLLHLLRALLSPFDSLALASALRSPVFSCTNDDLQALAKLPQRWWWHRLGVLASTVPPGHAPARAWRLLNAWQRQIDEIPVHDLLDRIYADANVVDRYLGATPELLQHRVEANLSAFLELALEADSGRYPSLSRFVDSIQRMTGDETAQGAAPTGNRVRIMTIHGAKGLESPVVFLADTARAATDLPKTFRTVVDWPATSDRPKQFLLVGRKSDRDLASERLLAEQQAADRREEANLLYVALTRAGQYLYISGCEPDRGGLGWYGFILHRLQMERASMESNAGNFMIRFGDSDERDPDRSPFVFGFGKADAIDTPSAHRPEPALEVDSRLMQPIAVAGEMPIVNPSTLEADRPDSGQDRDAVAIERARQRGVWTHRALELLPDTNDRQQLYQMLKTESDRDLSAVDFDNCWHKALEIVGSGDLARYFDSSLYERAYNELPVLYRRQSGPVFGIIDRVVLTDHEAIVIDYKTHESATPGNIELLAQPYFTQMRFYGDAVARLWPNRKVTLLLLFTECAGVVDVPYPVT
jgi:ATP-dependent helicase/nuclease subunit A